MKTEIHLPLFWDDPFLKNSNFVPTEATTTDS